MTRLIILGLLLVVLWLAVRSFALQLKVSLLGQGRGRHDPFRPPAAATETLVRCAGCGTYVASSRTLRLGDGRDEAFCSEDCRRRGAA
jgi:hypothetical protein